MPGNTLIKFSGIDKGESLQSTHPGSAGWLEIGDWSWDIEAEASHLKGTGSAVGKPTPGTLSFSHYFDNSSTVIMDKIVNGTHFEDVVIEMLKQTGTSKPQVFFQIKVIQAFITKVSTKGGEDGAMNQDVEMVFKDIVVSYKPQDQDKGGLGATAYFKWNIPKMNDATDVKNFMG